MTWKHDPIDVAGMFTIDRYVRGRDRVFLLEDDDELKTEWYLDIPSGVHGPFKTAQEAMACESSLCSQELAGECSEENSLDGKQLDTSNGTTIASECSQPESGTASLTKPQYSGMSSHSTIVGTPKHIRDWLTSSQQDSPAKHSASQESTRERWTRATCGRQPLAQLELLDQGGVCWKTYQLCLPGPMGTSDRFSKTWPSSGMLLDGVCYQLPIAAPPICESGSGLLPTPSANPYGTNQGGAAGRTGPVRPSLQTMARKGLWPTPTVTGNNNRKGMSKESGDGLATAVRKFETPSASDGKRCGLREEQIGGPLNPEWVEFLMGWPTGHTDLKPLEMGRSPSVQQQHGVSCQEDDES